MTTHQTLNDQFAEVLALKPCPFCGGSSLQSSSRTSGHGESTAYITCRSCDARMEDYYGKPAEKWNTRVDAAKDAEIAALVKECDRLRGLLVKDAEKQIDLYAVYETRALQAEQERDRLRSGIEQLAPGSLKIAIQELSQESPDLDRIQMHVACELQRIETAKAALEGK